MNATPEALRSALQRAARRARKFGCAVHLTTDSNGILVSEVIPPHALRKGGWLKVRPDGAIENGETLAPLGSVRDLRRRRPAEY